MYEQMDCSIIILKQMTGNSFWVLGQGIFKGFVKHMGFFSPIDMSVVTLRLVSTL